MSKRLATKTTHNIPVRLEMKVAKRISRFGDILFYRNNNPKYFMVIFNKQIAKAWYDDESTSAFTIRHKVDGPAVILSTGDKYWCLNNQEYKQKQWLNKLLKVYLPN